MSLYVLGGLILILLVVLFVTKSPSSSGLSRIESITTIDLPSDVTNVSTAQGSGYTSGHLTIPTAEIADFITKNGFRQGRITYSLMGIDKLASQYRTVPRTANYVREAMTSDARWLFLLDRTSGDVWFTVYK